MKSTRVWTGVPLYFIKKTPVQAYTPAQKSRLRTKYDKNKQAQSSRANVLFCTCFWVFTFHGFSQAKNPYRPREEVEDGQ